jgi:biotin carboxyl carrier protein
MIDISNIKSPGWQRVVGDLSQPLPDDRVFLLRMLSTLAMVSGARQGVLHALSPGASDNAPPEVKAAQVWPFPQGVVDASGRVVAQGDDLMDPARVDASAIERPKDQAAAARAAAASRQLHVYSLDEDQFYETSAKPHVVAVPIASGLPAEASGRPPRAIVSLVVEARSRQALQSTLALLEVLAGYAFTHEAQQALRRTRQASASLDLAARLIASMNSTNGFKAAALQLANDLCRQLSVDRVALGWTPGSPRRWSGRQAIDTPAGQSRTIHLRALSDTENLDRRMEMCRKLESAMEETLDQQQTVLFPAPPAAGPGADPVLSQAVTHAHRELARNDANLRVASFPLRVVDAQGERIAGVVLVESSGAGRLDVGACELVQATLDLVAPVLAVRASDDRALHLRAWDACLKAAAWGVGPRHTAWKVAGIALMLATLVLFLGRTTYRIGAPMELRAQSQRVVAAPIDGLILRIPEGVQSGARVSAGQLLLEMDDRELVLSALEAQGQFVQADKRADEMLKKGDLAQAAQERAKAQQAKARMELFQLQAERSKVRSAIDGAIISSDIRDKVGAAVRLGDPLFEVADLATMVVVAHVEDRDISYIRVGQTGEVSPKANPSLTVPITVTQIVPLAQAREGVNAFEVRCELAGERPAWFLPGLEGQVKLNTQPRTFAWIASRRVLDTLREWLWW